MNVMILFATHQMFAALTSSHGPLSAVGRVGGAQRHHRPDFSRRNSRERASVTSVEDTSAINIRIDLFHWTKAKHPLYHSNRAALHSQEFCDCSSSGS